MDPGIKAQRRIFLFKNYCSTFDLVNLKTPRTCIQGKSHFLMIEILEPSKDGRWKSESGFCPECMWCVFSNGPNQTKVSHTYSNKGILKHQRSPSTWAPGKDALPQTQQTPAGMGRGALTASGLRNRPLQMRLLWRGWPLCNPPAKWFYNKNQCIKLPTANW